MHKRHHETGFSLIELAISIAFIATLALTVSIITINTISSYQRGVTLKTINTLSGNLIDDFRGAISNSSAKGVASLCDSLYSNTTVRGNCANDGAYKFVYNVVNGSVSIFTSSGEQKISETPLFGAFCSGTYSYIWNSGYFFKPKGADATDKTYYKVNTFNEPASFKFKLQNDSGNFDTKTLDNFRLIKILDPSRAVCVSRVNSDYNGFSTSNLFDISADTYPVISEAPVDLFADIDGNFALYNYEINRPAQDNLTRNVFYSSSFIIGTINGGINVKATGNYCTAPDNYDSTHLDYCTINQFNFAAQATGE